MDSHISVICSFNFILSFCLSAMSSLIAFRISLLSLGSLCKSLAISAFVFFIFWTTFMSTHLHHHYSSKIFDPFMNKCGTASRSIDDSPTNVAHLVFGIAGSVRTWRLKKPYVESWWQPNNTRGFLFLDRAPPDWFLPWPLTSPPFRVSEDISKLQVFSKHAMPSAVRIARMILETFREENGGARWYIMGDDDTIFFVDNLVEVLARYDHTEYLYLGATSECVKSNFDHSFAMAFGGAGFALSYPLAAALAMKFDECILLHPNLYVSDHILQSCLADLGVSLTHEKGFHQIDLHNDISGLLSAHPQSPLLSLHHLHAVDPIFPSMSRYESVNHLMEAAKADSSRLLQQTICYNRQSNWSFSISWGYSVQIYETIFPLSILQIPLETFTPWNKAARPPFFMFNTRPLLKTPCEAPHVFYFESVERTAEDQIVTTYVRRFRRGIPPCSSSGNHSADPISKIQVLSQLRTSGKGGSRRQCCDIVEAARDMNVTEVKFRACTKDEIVD